MQKNTVSRIWGNGLRLNVKQSGHQVSAFLLWQNDEIRAFYWTYSPVSYPHKAPRKEASFKKRGFMIMGMFTVLALAYFPVYAILCHHLSK
jgi:hypothetical protein